MKDTCTKSSFIRSEREQGGGGGEWEYISAPFFLSLSPTHSLFLLSMNAEDMSAERIKCF